MKKISGLQRQNVRMFLESTLKKVIGVKIYRNNGFCNSAIPCIEKIENKKAFTR